jgi:BirA family biotin operon repressor/biotin-[acetyl-CoA-carboxylase] ligase
LDAHRLTARLSQLRLIRRVVVLPLTDSTNDDAKRLAADGAPEGTVVVAERQTAGRGRLGRTWDSPEGLGLYLSVLLRPVETAPLLGRYSIATAVATCEACRRLAGKRVVLKWPNDVLAGGAKVAGILAELRQGRSGAELVLGIGINVNQRSQDFPPDVRTRATSLRMLASEDDPLDRESVAVGLLESLDDTIGRMRASFSDVADRFLRYAPAASGSRVRLAAGGEGSTIGLDSSGALRVATGDGVVLVHASESVTLLEE